MADEERLLRDERIDVVVTKNSGGSATAGKLAAARNLGLPVVMLARPPLPQTDTVGSVGEVLAWLEQHHAAAATRRIEPRTAIRALDPIALPPNR